MRRGEGRRANTGRERTSVLTVVAQNTPVKPSPLSLLDELVRDGAKRMLIAALEAEVAAYIERHAQEPAENGRRLVVRNGYRCEREVPTFRTCR